MTTATRPGIDTPAAGTFHAGNPDLVRSAPGGGLGIDEILGALRRRYRLVLAAACLAGAGGVAIALREDPTFTATAVVRIGDARRALTSGIEAPDAAPVERLASPFLSQVQLLRSRTLIGAVVDSVGLRLVPDFKGFRPRLVRDVRVAPDAPADSLRLRFTAREVHVAMGGDSVTVPYGQVVAIGGVQFVVVGRPVADSTTWRVASREKAIDALLGKLKVKPRTQTNVVDLGYSARRPSVAQLVVNTVATQFQSSSAATAQDQSRRRRVFLETQLRQSAAELESAQRALAAYRAQVKVYGSSEQLRTRQRDLERLDERLAQLEAEQRMYASLLGTLSEPAPGAREEGMRGLMSAPGIRDNPAVVQLHGQLARLQARHDSSTTGEWRSAATDPDVQRTAEMIRNTEAQLVGTVRGHLAWLDAQRRSLAGVRHRDESSLGTLSSLEAEELRLQEEVAAIRGNAERLREDHQKARMAEAVEVGPVEVVDLATLPYEPDAMLRVLKVVLALLVGIAVGAAVAIWLEVRNDSIRFPDEIERLLQLPELGVIPRARRTEVRTSAPAAAPRFAALLTAPTRRSPRATTVTAQDRGAPLEAYRVLRTNLLYSRESTAVRSLVVTSAAPSEGKSITSANLATSCASIGLRVLLIDCDLRRARLHKLFGITAGPGLVQVLGGGVPAAAAIRPTRSNGLALLPAGPLEDSQQESLRSTRMLALIRTLTEQYDLVILDTPPVLAVADASVLAAIADGVLMVVRAGRTSRKEARFAIDQLDNVGARLLGAVLNDVATDALPYPQYYLAYHGAVAGTA